MNIEQIWALVISTAITVIVTLTATLIFNKVTSAPKKLKEEKQAQTNRINSIDNHVTEVEESVHAVECRVECTEEAISHYPEYRQQSISIQQQLQNSDQAIIALCEEIRKDVVANGKMLDERLTKLEEREKNSLRTKILQEYRLLTDTYKNPMQA